MFNLFINQEADIIMLIGGLQKLIETVLDIKADDQHNEDDINEDEMTEEEMIRIGKLSKSDKNANQGFFTKMFGGGEATIFNTDPFSEVKLQIHKMLSDVLISCIYCWNHLEFFNWNDYHFTRYGMFSFYYEDTRKIVRMKKKLPKQQDN